MTSKQAFFRTFVAVAAVASVLSIASVARAEDDTAAQAAKASDPEYTAGYSKALASGTHMGECNDKAYATREAFTNCQEQALERTHPAGHVSTGARIAVGPRNE